MRSGAQGCDYVQGNAAWSGSSEVRCNPHGTNCRRGHTYVIREELLAQLTSLRQARVAQVPVPHKPLLLLWLFGQFAATGSSAATYQQAEEPVSQLINDFGPPVASPAAARQRAAMSFVHLERELWDLRDAAGREITPDAPERRAWLLELEAVGCLRSPVERLLADPGTLAAATRLLLEQHFTPVLAELICAAVDLDVAALDLAGNGRTAQAVRSRLRRRGFAEEVLRAYAYQCAMCGFDGALGRYPVGIQAAHVRWHSQEGLTRRPNARASVCAAPRAVRPGYRRHHRGPADLRIRPICRQECGGQGGG